MKISVVVPFFNEEERIGACISALSQQHYPQNDYEVILVDNNSTDSSAEIVKRSARVRLVSEKTQGDFAARNRGIAEAKGRIIAFTDADTAPRVDWLQKIEAAFRDSETLMVFGRLFFSSDSNWLTLLAAYDAEKTAFVYSNDIPELYFAFTCNMAVRREVFDELGVFPNVMRNADTVFARRLIEAYSCSAARYDPAVAVDRLEVSTLLQYYAKLNTYGRDFAKYSRVAPVRALNSSERLSIFRRTTAKHECSPVQSALFLTLLAVGAIAYDSGRILGSIRTR